VLKTTATTGEGVPELVQAINNVGSNVKAEGAAVRRRRRARYLIARAAADIVAERVRHGGNEGLDNLSDQVLAGDLSPEAAAKKLLDHK
jgi:LAO/AO transport system kinase